jgi:pyrimidine operon attenuation protein/uracil phosphoribosyltransferase
MVPQPVVEGHISAPQVVSGPRVTRYSIPSLNLRPLPQSTTTLLDARAMDRTLRRMADEILELNDGTDGLILVGIQRRGVQLADRIARLIEDREGVIARRGALDITLYRDDLQTVGPRPVVGPTDIPGDMDNARVVIVDDVLYTGRTVRAALDELADFGRPARIALAVLVDRGGRELPIHADVVGKRVDLRSDQRVDVLVAELDGRDAVIVVPTGAPFVGAGLPGDGRSA